MSQDESETKADVLLLEVFEAMSEEDSAKTMDAMANLYLHLEEGGEVPDISQVVSTWAESR